MGHRLLMLIILGALCSCATGKNSTGGAHVSYDALRAQVTGSRELISINSLNVSPATTTRGLQVDTADLSRFSDAVASAFVAEAGIDVHYQPGSKGSQTKSDSDATLFTEVTRYSKDKASTLGAAQAALLGVSYSIVRNSDQREIWQSSFFSTENTDSINLIEVTKRIGRDKGTQLPRIEDLEKQAAKSAAIDFATRRVQQFTER